MTLRVGINGFGRIGRLVVRAAKKRGADIDFVAVNDVTDAPTLAHLLQYDSVHGTWPEAVTAEGDAIRIGGDEIKVLKIKDPAELPWKDLGVDIVLEATGIFTDRDKAIVHRAAGARVVAVSAPSKGADATIVLGVNDADYEKGKHEVVSVASCTTNCLAPVAKVLHEHFGIERGFMTTMHAYTNDQRILDLPHKDLRRARSAARQHDPDLDRRREGDRPRAARAGGTPRRRRHARARARRLGRRPHRHRQEGDRREGDQRRVRRRRRIRAAHRHPQVHRGAAGLERHRRRSALLDRRRRS